MQKTWTCLVWAFCALVGRVTAQTTGDQPASAADTRESEQLAINQLTMFAHPDDTPWFVAGQSNIIFQANPPFHSPYEGTNSFVGRGEYKTSLLGTLYLGVQPWELFSRRDTPKMQRYNTDLILDIESAGGRGLSEALGLAGFTNLDVVRNPSLGSTPYIARVQVHQTIGFSDESVKLPRGPLALATRVPVRRLDLRVGRMSLPDVFDLNAVLSDSHLQFTNWTVDNSGSWDYAADTRGYTYAAVVEYQERAWALRYGLALMPTVANGIDLDWNVRRARGQNMEGEWRHGLLPGLKGAQRVLAFVNTAHMGNYREAVNAYLSGVDSTPDITKHAHTGAVKYGFSYNFEQSLTAHLRLGGRTSWNNGRTEDYAYTEVEQNVLLGADYDGAQWGRPDDKIGLAYTSNAIKRDHQHYLAYGGLGFLLGDGHLQYAREDIVEGYYNAHAWRGLYFAMGGSFIEHPGYNVVRGPIWVPSVRAHVDF